MLKDTYFILLRKINITYFNIKQKTNAATYIKSYKIFFLSYFHLLQRIYFFNVSLDNTKAIFMTKGIF